MGISGTINQVTSIADVAYVNLNTGYGIAEAWGTSYNTPAYLCFAGFVWFVKVFDDKDYAEEWFESDECKNTYAKIYKIVENGLEEIR